MREIRVGMTKTGHKDQKKQREEGVAPKGKDTEGKLDQSYRLKLR